MLFLRRSRLPDAARMSLADALADPTFELIPLKSTLAQAEHLPAGATVSITASPAKGTGATLDLAAELSARGFRVVAHLSARMIRDRAELRGIVARLRDLELTRAFVVGGDEKEPGEFPDGLALLRALAELDHPLAEIGIPCYPQGHAFIPDGALLDALAAKAPYATSMTTQLCFDPDAISTWVRARRADGLALPVKIGLPGVAEPHRLLAITARIGVADTRRFLTKNTRFVARLLRSGGFYRPDALLEGLAPLIADPSAAVAGLHVYTFNAVDVTEPWRRSYLAKLGRTTGG